MRILGIDVGFSGGLAVITDEGVLIEYQPMPVIISRKPTGRKSKKTGKEIIKVTTYLDIPALATLIDDMGPDIAVIEKVSSMPKQGIAGAFRFGEQYGAIQGILCAFRISQRFIRPQEWKARVLAGYDSKDKGSSLLYVKRRWPVNKIEGTKQQREGQADAICIALSNGGER